MKEKMMQFLRDEEGLTAVEYAVAGALVVAGLVAAFRALGEAATTVIQGLANEINAG